MPDLPAPLTDADVTRLQSLLDAVPAPLQPLDVSALDGFLCGVLLQPRPVPAQRWLPYVSDMDARPAPAGADLKALQALALRRHAELDQAITTRAWFDPWIFLLDADGGDGGGEEPAAAGSDADPDADADTDADTDADADPAADVPPPVREAVLPWVAGFAAAMDAFPALMAHDAPALVEPLALLYLYFEPEDLEDADALLAVIETLAPPADLADAVQDVVRALMLLADVTRPRASRRQPAGRNLPRRGGGRRPAKKG